MSETKVPAAEAEAIIDGSDELSSYELAFHVLPTVAEGEVGGVFDSIKDAITKTGASVFDEESPERFDLAYEIEKHLEGKNRKFKSAYFGWVRFKCESSVVEKITTEMEENSNLLRYLLIKLTKVEEESPFRFHETIKDEKMVTTVEESSVVPDFTTVKSDESADEDSESEKKDEEGEVDEEEINKALEKKEV